MGGRFRRTPLRAWAYGAAMLYFALLIIGNGVGHLRRALFAAGAGPDRFEAALFMLRTEAVALLNPLADALSRLWPMGGSLLLAWPLVALGFVWLLAAFLAASAVDLIRRMLQK